MNSVLLIFQLYQNYICSALPPLKITSKRRKNGVVADKVRSDRTFYLL